MPAASTILNASNVQISGGVFHNSASPPSRGEEVDQPESTKMRKKIKKKWQVWLKSGDEIPKIGRPNDIIISVMGATGTGKSTFINALLGDQVARVGHDFDTGTRELQQFWSSIPDEFPQLRGHRLVILDTPGFDDMYLPDQEILRRISAWLAYAYTQGMTIAGMIYLYDISQPRLHPSTMRNTEIFRRLCGENALSTAVLVTTKWGLVKDEDGIAREKSYRNGLWKDMILAGSTFDRFDNTPKSAHKIMGRVIAKFQNTYLAETLQIQQELVDLDRRISETSAGQVLHLKIIELYKLQKKRCTIGDITEEERRRIEDLITQVKDLNITISRRILIFFGLA